VSVGSVGGTHEGVTVSLASHARAFVVLAFGCCAIGCARNAGVGDGADPGPRSDAESIVGKWKVLMGDEKAKDDERAWFYIEFKSDGTVWGGIETSDPDLKKMFGEPKQVCKYKVSGDTIEMFEPAEKTSFTDKTARLAFDGAGGLTITPADEKDKPVKLVRMRPSAGGTGPPPGTAKTTRPR
jgi:hypothetical protein